MESSSRREGDSSYGGLLFFAVLLEKVKKFQVYFLRKAKYINGTKIIIVPKNIDKYEKHITLFIYFRHLTE